MKDVISRACIVQQSICQTLDQCLSNRMHRDCVVDCESHKLRGHIRGVSLQRQGNTGFSSCLLHTPIHKENSFDFLTLPSEINVKIFNEGALVV